MPTATNISLAVSPKQVFDLAQQLSKKERIQLIELLELEQYADNIPEEHKKLVRQRIKKYNRNPELLIDELKALKMINAM